MRVLFKHTDIPVVKPPIKKSETQLYLERVERLEGEIARERAAIDQAQKEAAAPFCLTELETVKAQEDAAIAEHEAALSLAAGRSQDVEARLAAAQSSEQEAARAEVLARELREQAVKRREEANAGRKEAAAIISAADAALAAVKDATEIRRGSIHRAVSRHVHRQRAKISQANGRLEKLLVKLGGLKIAASDPGENDGHLVDPPVAVRAEPAPSPSDQGCDSLASAGASGL